MFTVFGLVLVALFIFGLITGMQEYDTKRQRSKSAAKITVTVESMPDKSTIFNEAKNTLKAYGFSVSDAKDMLKKAGPHEDVDAWIKAALETIEV